jgi:S-adenosylmethionine hydrolase
LSAPVITFLSDYGLADEFVGVCHAVIARRCPAARIIDLTHGIPRGDIRAGALALRAAMPYAPAGVHLAVVDPGVGTGRRALALRTQSERRILVGPDNGLLWPAACAFGGATEAFDVGASPERLEPVSKTFHGRDVFAPVAAAICDGVALAALGVPVDPAGLVVLEFPEAVWEGSVLRAQVLSIDLFGNVALDVNPATIAGRSALVVAGSAIALVGTFDEVPSGELLAYVDSRGALALAVNGGSAAVLLGLQVGDELALGEPA